MQKELEAAVAMIRKMSGASYTLSVVLAVLADLLIRALIPGSSILEIILSALAMILILLRTGKAKDPITVESIHQAYAG